MLNQVVVVGGGIGGVAAVETLRHEGYDGRVLLISEEAELPYDRPPLSKAYLSGEASPREVLLHDEAWYAAQCVDLELGQAVQSLDADGRTVTTVGGNRWSFDKLVLATGSRARALAGVRQSAGGRLHYLRTRADADRLRKLARPGSRVILIGGGVIGMEAAATVTQMGCKATVLEAAERVMARFFPEYLSERLTELHRSRGVDVRTGVVVDGIESTGKGVVVKLRDGTSVDGDWLLVGVGVVANGELAARAGLAIRQQSIEVNAHAQTSSPDIYAAGDVTTFRRGNGDWTRWENWTHARNQAAVAVRHMLGKAPAPYDEIPWVWSDQYEFNLQVTGSPVADTVVRRGLVETGKLTLFHLLEGCIVGATTVNDSRHKSAIRKFIDKRAAIAPEVLIDPAVDLKKLAAGM